MLRGLPHFLCSAPYFRGQHRAAEEMGANGLGKIPTTSRAQVRAPPRQDVGGEFVVAQADATGRAPDDDVARAVDEHQRSLLRRQDLRSLAVNVRQTAVARLDDVSEHNRPRALRAIHLHEASRVPPLEPQRTARSPEDLVEYAPFHR